MSMMEGGNCVKNFQRKIGLRAKIAWMNAASIVALAALSLFATFAHADDGAVSIAAGGIVMKRESRITMAKEVLTIGLNRVKVDYEFRNDTSEDITTEVAFPVPGYKCDWDEHALRALGFDDFHLTVDGVNTRFRTEARAKLKGKDVTATLTAHRIDVGSFGHFDEATHLAGDIRRLTALQRARLIQVGLLCPSGDEDKPLWTVEKKYYWSQSFPGHATVQIHHEYKPVAGSENSIRYGWKDYLGSGGGTHSPKRALDQEATYLVEQLKSFCINPALQQQLSLSIADDKNNADYSYVDFILTTANTWKRPIEDFTLIVERPKQGKLDSRKPVISFCWDGPVIRNDEGDIVARYVDLVPRRELRIGFFFFGANPMEDTTPKNY